MFELAVATADTVVERELRQSSGKLLSKAEVGEVMKGVGQQCWKAFEDELFTYPWSKSLTQYKAARALVQTETLTGHMSRFVVANDKRLSAHFRAALEQALLVYKANESAIPMPAPEAEIDAEHSRLSSYAIEMMDVMGSDLKDTDAFKDAMDSLNTAMAEGYQHIRAKNVEFWKVHADEATRCAMTTNHERDRQCGLFCVFNKVPWAYKVMTRRHLYACFAKTTLGSQMSPELQAQVFEVWYSKDLGRDAAAITSRFYMIIITAVVLIIAGWWWLYGQYLWRPTYARQQVVYQQPGFYAQPQCYFPAQPACFAQPPMQPRWWPQGARGGS
jgi:hypothetical protein